MMHHETYKLCTYVLMYRIHIAIEMQINIIAFVHDGDLFRHFNGRNGHQFVYVKQFLLL